MKSPDDAAAAGRWHDPARIAPWLVLAVSLAATYLLWQQAHRSSIQEQRIEFDSQVQDLVDRLHRQLAYSEQVLYGVRSFYLNQKLMERHEYSGYIDSLEIEKNFPGIQGISFNPLVSNAHKAELTASLRKSGVTGYTIKPDGNRPSYAPVAYIAPHNERNARALGFDNLTDPARKATIEQARDEDRAVISEKLVLRQESTQTPQPGFLMFLPIYQHDAAHDNLATRRANIRGWFAASFRVKDMMAGVLDEHFSGIGIDIFDGGTASAGNRMYGSDDGAGQQGVPLYSVTLPVNLAGSDWTMQFHSLPEFEQQRDTSVEHKAVLTGGLFGLLLSLLTWLLMRDRQRVLHTSWAIERELEMRKQAELKIRDLLTFNEAILDASPSGIAVFNIDGVFLMSNEAYAKAFGTIAENVLQQNFHQNRAWQDTGLTDFARQAFETGDMLRHDVEVATSQGKKQVLECTFAPISIADRPHLLLIVNDVSGRVETELALTASMRQLEQKELAKTRFLAAAGHDLRQPLAAANLFIDALKLHKPSPEQQQIIQRLDQAMSSFTELLDSLLNISRLDAGVIKPEYTVIDVAEIFKWLEQSFAPVAGEKQLGFKLFFPAKEMMVINSDIGLLKSVLMNLVSNAIKYTSNGAVMVSARRRGSNVLFQVWDTGIGIDADQQAHIFDEFYQINNSQRDRTRGLGLGLAIARRALTLLGGEIDCRSRSGRGSVFGFRLPLHGTASGMARHAVAAVRQPDVNREGLVQGKHIIVVEDDALVAEALCNALVLMKGEVECFHNAEDALLNENIGQADYYIVDYMLGGKLNGIQFLNRLRQKFGQPVNAVLMTGDTSPAFVRGAAECDWPVLHKPVTISKLITSLGARDAELS